MLYTPSSNIGHIEFCSIIIENKPDLEKLHLINQLDEEDKQTIFRLVEKMLTNKKFKDFFAKNAAAL